MNILFTPSDNNSDHGAFQSMVKLASILQNHYGHGVLVVLPYKGNGKELLDRNNIKSIMIPSYSWVVPESKKNELKTGIKQIVKRIYNLKAVHEIEKIIRSEKIDIVHNNTSWAYVGAAAAKHSGTPLVWHIREFLEEDQALCIWNRKAGYRLMRKADRVITISSSLYEKYSAIIDPQKIMRIFNGVDPQRFYCSEHSPFQGKKLHFLIVGAVEEWKGHADAVEACIMLLNEHFDQFELTIVGYDRTQYAEDIKSLIYKGNAEKYIRLTGETNTPEDYYKQADITFMCSRSEAFGRVTVEAMLAGSLVVGASIAGTLDVIRDGETGIFYTPGDIPDLKNKILYAINHPEEARLIAKQGQTDALKRFTAETNAMNVNAVYEEVLQKQEQTS